MYGILSQVKDMSVYQSIMRYVSYDAAYAQVLLFHQSSKLWAEGLCLSTSTSNPMSQNSIIHLHKQLRVSPNHSPRTIAPTRIASRLGSVFQTDGAGGRNPPSRSRDFGIHSENGTSMPCWHTENLIQRYVNHQALLKSLNKLHVYSAGYHQFMENPHRFRSPLDDSLEENVVWHTIESERCTTWIPSLHPHSKGLRTMKRLRDVWTSLGFFIYWKLKDSAWPGIWWDLRKRAMQRLNREAESDCLLTWRCGRMLPRKTILRPTLRSMVTNHKWWILEGFLSTCSSSNLQGQRKKAGFSAGCSCIWHPFKKTDFLPPFGGLIKKWRAVKWVLAARAMPAEKS